MDSKIIILRGNSGSGKTSVARKLQRSLGRGTLLISQDMIRREMLWVNDGNETKAISLLMDLVLYGKENCEFVILEGILNSEWYHKLFERIKLEYGSKTYAYYYDISFEETLVRHKSKPNCNEFGETEMKSWWKEKDYLELLSEKRISKEISLEKAVKMIYYDVMGVELTEL